MVLGILWWVRRVPVLVFAGIGLMAAEVPWKQLFTAENDLPMPSTAKLHAGTVVADFDRDGTNDIVVAFGDAAPALVLLHGGTNWMRLPIELEFLPLAAGGAAVDIDQDKDADLVFGSAKGSELWWWENPAPEFDPNKSWVRRLITDEGGTGYGEILFTDVIGSIRPQLVYWNRGSNSLHFAEIPASPRLVSNWVTLQIFSAPLPAGELPSRMGLADADINIDGRGDLLAGNFWLQRSSGRNFEATRIGDAQGLALAGRFRPRTYPHLVVAPTGGPGPLRWYEALTDPGVPRSWAGRDLLSHEISPAGTLALADFDGNGLPRLEPDCRSRPPRGRPFRCFGRYATPQRCSSGPCDAA